MVPEIWSSTDRIVLSSWAIFHSFTPLKTRKMTISKMKKTLNKMEVSSFYTSVPKTIIIRHVPEIRHVMDVIAIFILGYTFPFYFPNSPKTWKFQNNEKKRLEISSFFTNVPKIIICYTVPEIWCLMDVIVVLHFGIFFALLAPSSPKNENFKTIKKQIPGDIII